MIPFRTFVFNEPLPSQCSGGVFVSNLCEALVMGNVKESLEPGGEGAECFVSKTKAAPPVPLDNSFVGGEESGYFAQRPPHGDRQRRLHRTVEAPRKGVASRAADRQILRLQTSFCSRAFPDKANCRAGGEEI